MDTLEKVIRCLPPVSDAREDQDPVLRVRLFTPDANWQLFIAGGCPDEDGDVVLYGYLVGSLQEWRHFRLSSILHARGPAGRSFEVDLSFRQLPWSQVVQTLQVDPAPTR